MDTLIIEMIPFCSKLLRGEKAKIISGVDGACVPLNPSHPSYSVETLRNLFISYLYLFKWVKWDPVFIAHGSLVSSVLGAEMRLHDDLPYCMEVGSLCKDILAYHPDLSGNRVHDQVHPSFIDRSIPEVLIYS